MELALKVEEKNRIRNLTTNDSKSHNSSIFKANFFSPFSYASKTPSQQLSFSSYSSGTKSSPWGARSESGSVSPGAGSLQLSSYSQNLQNSPKIVFPSLPMAKPIGEAKRLKASEVQQKRERGLCFRCDEKWMAGHRCKRRELF